MSEKLHDVVELHDGVPVVKFSKLPLEAAQMEQHILRCSAAALPLEERPIYSVQPTDENKG